MIEVRDMTDVEIDRVLERVGYGHLACSKNDRPYVVPIHYAYESPDIYIYTTEGKKSEIIDANPEVCLQVEEIETNRSWRSVIVYGRAEHIFDKEEREAAVAAITELNPSLTPALSVRWMDSLVRANIEVIYRITPHLMTGRETVSDENVASGDKQQRQSIQ